MEIVIPHGIDAPSSPLDRKQVLGSLRLVLGDEHDAALRRLAPRVRRHFSNDVPLTVVEDRLSGIESKAIEVKFPHPVTRVVDDQITCTLAALAVEIESFAPLGSVPGAEIAIAEAAQIVAVGTEMVVDDIEDHREPERMCGVDEALEGLVIAVVVKRRKEMHAVVAPTPASGEFRDRQHFDQGDADVLEPGQPLDRCVERACFGEGADVQLVDHLTLQRDSFPVPVAPLISMRLHEQRRTMRAFGLITRAGIRPGSLAVDSISIEIAHRRFMRIEDEVAVRCSLHIERLRSIFQDDLDALGVGSPNTEVGYGILIYIGARRECSR